MTRLALGSLALLVLLGACQQAPRNAASATATAACRVEVDRVYAAQNRVELSRRDERDTPFSASYLPGNTTRRLSERFGLDNQMASCLAQSGAPTGPGNASTGPTFSPSSP